MSFLIVSYPKHMSITSHTQAQGGVGGLTQQQHMMLLQQQQQSLAHQMLQQQHHAQAVAQQQLARSKEALMSVSAERRYFEQVCLLPFLYLSTCFVWWLRRHCSCRCTVKICAFVRCDVAHGCMELNAGRASWRAQIHNGTSYRCRLHST
jgi:hypothetical protein